MISCLLAWALLQAPVLAESSSNGLSFRKDPDGYVLVLKPGEQIVMSLKALAARQNIKGASFTGLGAVRKVEISYYDVEQKRYVAKKFPEAVELLNLTGNLSWFEGKPWVHAHVTLGDQKYQSFGGHLEEAEVSVTTEIFISTLSRKLNRFLDPALNMKLIDLDARP